MISGVEIPWTALAWLAIPLVLLGLTSFTKISVVLAALRSGLGIDTILPAPAIYTLALLVTAITMAPTITECVSIAGAEMSVGGALEPGALYHLLEPLLEFARVHADEAELEWVRQLSGRELPDPLVTALAFMLSELSEAFRAIVYLLVPFLLIDLLVAQLCGMLAINVQQQLISLPLKLLLFLSVNGWHLVIGGLVRAYTGGGG